MQVLEQVLVIKIYLHLPRWQLVNVDISNINLLMEFPFLSKGFYHL